MIRSIDAIASRRSYQLNTWLYLSLLHGGLEWRVGALMRYPSSDAEEFGLLIPKPRFRGAAVLTRISKSLSHRWSAEVDPRSGTA